MTSFEDIRLSRTSTANQVANGIRIKILRGELKPGEPLRENAIASDLNISRNTVREAARLLEKSGLVKYEFNRGTVVIQPSLEDLVELYRARVALEVAAASTAHTADSLSRVRQTYDLLVEAAHRGDAREIVARDLAFHTALVGLIGSDRINDFYAQLVRELEFYLMVLSDEEREYERPDFVTEEHQPIMEALEANDPARAARVVSAHIQSSTERIKRIIARKAT
jgi:DNA-binding GntR family transcriptional regulator